MNVKVALGARIKELRKNMGYTQETFAELIGVVPRHVSRIESGINTPSIEALDNIAKVLNVEIKELYNFQHLENEEFLKNDIKNILENIKGDKLIVAHKILSSIFR